MNYNVYLLYNSINNYTYIGSTNNLTRRIRQHNGELVGGAKYTRNKKQNGLWIIYGIINNLDKHTALSIEKKIQIKSKKSKGKTPIERRIVAINSILMDYENILFNIINYHNILQNDILLQKDMN